MVSPRVNTLSAATHRLTFWASGNDDSTIVEIGTLNNNTADAVFTSLEPITLGEQYAAYTVDFSNYDGTDNYIAFRNASTSDYSSVYIDDIVWEVIPSCPDVTAISISDRTTNGAVVSWEAGSFENGWQVSYTAASVTNPEMGTISEELTDTVYDLTDLDGATAYNVWVRSVCGSTNGNWIGPIAFNTECDAVASFTENFDSVSFPAIPVCWNEMITGGDGADISVSPYSFTSGPNSVTIFGANSGAGANIILISPAVTTLASGEYTLKFMATGSHPLEIGTLNGTDSEATFTAFETVTLSDFDSESFTVDFASYTGTDTYIGFRLATDGMNSYASIDDVIWSSSLSSGGFEQSKFNYYPNPVKDVLTVSYEDTITNVTVFNLLGQKVMEHNANTTSVRMDMSALASGSYIVKVASNDQVQSIKVIKQ